MTLRMIVGLGNPGRDYAKTRHNAGFWWAARVAQAWSITLQPEAKFFGLVGHSDDSQSIYVLLPQTFMNASGKSVAALARFYKVEPEQILVAHDDLDLSPGVARLKQGGGHGGHNGLKDIAAVLGTPNFWRLRLGIGHPGHRDAVVEWVLNVPRADEMAQLEQAVDRSLQLLPKMVRGEFAAAMLELHTQT